MIINVDYLFETIYFFPIYIVENFFYPHYFIRLPRNLSIFITYLSEILFIIDVILHFDAIMLITTHYKRVV